jgi:hypothetical protein
MPRSLKLTALISLLAYAGGTVALLWRRHLPSWRWRPS